ncbi:uncharacterized protein PV07_07615 [Cladophialophora immunda]|uniref:FAD/NAD(P)-binding domain-containing protein n=1 Tax=Cladophialophora immunda TaxID=569365 RepID=A0A0D2CC17_9EURO|nr:uncharacterized protein PV07_07615 [Cladophialophora immunda]KIW27920.1 hypothetical protein PV07_07615 [Cladophialophora immunda]
MAPSKDGEAFNEMGWVAGNARGYRTLEQPYDSTRKFRVIHIGAGASGITFSKFLEDRCPGVELQIYKNNDVGGTWLENRANYRTSLDLKDTPEQQKASVDNPELFPKYSKMIELELNIRFKLILNGTPEAEAAKEFAREEMTKKLSPTNPTLLNAIAPKNFGAGCSRRPTPENGFLESLIQDNVKVFTSPMQEINATGFVDSEGEQYDVDIIICATGFNTSWIPMFPVEANGHSISKMWATEAVSYLSIGVPNMLNYWTMSGSYGPNGHGSFLPIIELLTGNIIQCIQKMQMDRIKRVTPKP